MLWLIVNTPHKSWTYQKSTEAGGSIIADGLNTGFLSLAVNAGNQWIDQLEEIEVVGRLTHELQSCTGPGLCIGVPPVICSLVAESKESGAIYRWHWSPGIDITSPVGWTNAWAWAAPPKEISYLYMFVGSPPKPIPPVAKCSAWILALQSILLMRKTVNHDWGGCWPKSMRVRWPKMMGGCRACCTFCTK